MNRGLGEGRAVGTLLIIARRRGIYAMLVMHSAHTQNPPKYPRPKLPAVAAFL